MVPKLQVIFKQALVFVLSKIKPRLGLAIVSSQKTWGTCVCMASVGKRRTCQMKCSHSVPSVVDHCPPLEGIKTAQILLESLLQTLACVLCLESLLAEQHAPSLHLV